jgi:hypothetical protein
MISMAATSANGETATSNTERDSRMLARQATMREIFEATARHQACDKHRNGMRPRRRAGPESLPATRYGSGALLPLFVVPQAVPILVPPDLVRTKVSDLGPRCQVCARLRFGSHAWLGSGAYAYVRDQRC